MPSFKSYSSGHSSYDEKECEEEKYCGTMNSPSSTESSIPLPPKYEEINSSTLSMTDSDDSLPPPPPNDKFCFSSPSTIDSEDSLPPPPPPPDDVSTNQTSTSGTVESSLCSTASSQVTRLSRVDRTTSGKVEHLTLLSQHSYDDNHEQRSCSSNADDDVIEEESRASNQIKADLQSNAIEDVNESSDIDELPDSIRFDYSSLSFSSHSSTNLPQQLSSQRLDPPACYPDLERQTKVALQTCFTILQRFALRCTLDHMRKVLLVVNCEEDILSCCTSISRLSSDSILSSYNNQSKLNMELQSKRLVFTTLQSHVQQKKTISKALDILDKLSQNITLRNALTKWATISKRITLLTTLIQARNDRLLKTVFGFWRELTRREFAKRQSLYLMMVFNRWRMLVDENKEEKEKDLLALLHWANNLTVKAFSALRMYAAKENKRVSKHVGFSFGHQRFVSPSNTGKYLSNSRGSSFISYRSPKPSMIFNRSPSSNHLGQSSYSSGGNYDVSRLNNMASRSGDTSQRLANMTSRTGDRPRFNNDITKSRTVEFNPFLRASSNSSSILSSPSSRNGGVLKVNRSLGRTIEQHADQTTQRSEPQPQTVIQRPSVTFSDYQSKSKQTPEAASVSNGSQCEYNLSYRRHGNTTFTHQMQRPGSQFTSTRPRYQIKRDRQANSSPQFPWDET